jgi:hypothetical protein
MTDVEKVPLESPESADKGFPSGGGTEAGQPFVEIVPTSQEVRAEERATFIEPPPEYDSLFGKIKAKRAESSGVSEFIAGVIAIILGTIGCTICIGCILVIPITMVAIGSVYVYDCPRERFIPVYLIVSGVFAIVAALSDIIQRCICKENHQQVQPDGRIRLNPIDCLSNVFLFAWFIAGNVWIYRTYNGGFQTIDKGEPDYCNPVLYWFAFWLMTGTYIVVALMLCCGCFCCCLAVSCGNIGNKKKRDGEA